MSYVENDAQLGIAVLGMMIEVEGIEPSLTNLPRVPKNLIAQAERLCDTKMTPARVAQALMLAKRLGDDDPEGDKIREDVTRYSDKKFKQNRLDNYWALQIGAL
jgi:hypothetical protein